uniref:Transmembrane protein n=1 Tax=Physcomitrium patens TaxID=3218 RepID=A0A2K1ITG4_PHYPA|nr:hypothetical protein PHYPA_024490 [Physcomitrium patens]
MCVSASSVSLFPGHIPEKGRSTYDSLPGGSNSPSLSILLFVWLSLASLFVVCASGGLVGFAVGFFALSFCLLSIAKKGVCVLTWGWNEGRGTSSSCEVGPSFRMMAFCCLVCAWVGFGGGSLPLPFSGKTR